MSKAPRGRRWHAFTLIELISVIAIIAVLATLTIAATERTFETARRTQARHDLEDLVTAVKSYYNEYGHYPVSPDQEGAEVTIRTDNSDLLYTLQAIPSGANANNALNPKGIAFINVPKAKNQTVPRSGLANGIWYDPWGQQPGKPESGIYHVRMDAAYRGYVTDPYPGTDPEGSWGRAPVIHLGVVAWSLAKSGLQTYDLRDQIISWK